MIFYLIPLVFSLCLTRSPNSFFKPNVYCWKGHTKGFCSTDFLFNIKFCIKYDPNIQLRAKELPQPVSSNNVCDHLDEFASHVIDDAPYCSSFYDTFLREQSMDQQFENSLGYEERTKVWVEGLFENKHVYIDKIQNRKQIFQLMHNLFPQWNANQN